MSIVTCIKVLHKVTGDTKVTGGQGRGCAIPLIHIVEEGGFIKFIVAEFLIYFECS